jgi:hypothetical protein
MSQKIDPYHRFLGIPPHLQPPNHYRLLGLEPFEDNLDVISDAADRQMAHVRGFEGGPYAAAAQKLLGELSTARVCLLLLERKAAYDAALRKQLAPAAGATPSPPRGIGGSSPPPAEEEELVLVSEPPPKTSSSSSVLRKSNSGIALHRSAPSASGIHQAAPSAAASRSIAVLPAAKPFSPIDPITYEPPYMGEYRRRFFETLLKVIIFCFILALLLLLFHALVLPWLKDAHSAGAPSFAKKAATSSTASDKSPLPPPLPISSSADSPAEAEKPSKLEIPVENEGESGAERNQISLFKTLQTAFRNNEVRRTRCIGEDFGDAFESKYGDGGLLVALKLTWKTFGKDGESRAVASVQPVYATSQGYVKGSIYGAPQKNGLRILARQGYAVGALKINYAPGSPDEKGGIIGLQIIFMRIEGLRLDPIDAYASSAFPPDCAVPHNAPEIGGNGDLAVGLCGSSSEEDLHSLGLLLLKRKAHPHSIADPRQTPSPDDVQSDAETPLPVEGKEFFIGSWHIYEDKRFESTITLYANEKARDSRFHDKGGKWEYKEDRVRILWKDGWEDVLERDGDDARKYSYAPGDPEERTRVNEGTALKSRLGSANQ